MLKLLLTNCQHGHAAQSSRLCAYMLLHAMQHALWYADILQVLLMLSTLQLLCGFFKQALLEFCLVLPYTS
jgi:hypothetical protein